MSGEMYAYCLLFMAGSELPDGDNLELHIWDTAGQERYQALVRGGFRFGMGGKIDF